MKAYSLFITILLGLMPYGRMRLRRRRQTSTAVTFAEKWFTRMMRWCSASLTSIHG